LIQLAGKNYTPCLFVSIIIERTFEVKVKILGAGRFFKEPGPTVCGAMATNFIRRDDFLRRSVQSAGKVIDGHRQIVELFFYPNQEVKGDDHREAVVADLDPQVFHF